MKPGSRVGGNDAKALACNALRNFCRAVESRNGVLASIKGKPYLKRMSTDSPADASAKNSMDV